MIWLKKSDTIKENSKTEIEGIPDKIKQLYQQEIRHSSSGLENIKATKEALLSSLYYSYIALHCLQPDPAKQQQIHHQVMEMVKSYGGNLSEFETQYEDLVSKYNTSFLEAQKKHRELTEKDKSNLKFCIILADLLQIPLNEKEIAGKFPLPTRIITGEEALAFNRAALTLNRNAELQRVKKYKELLYATFVADAELIKSTPAVLKIIEQYETVIKQDFPPHSEQDIEYLKFVIKHHARNIGINLKDLKADDNYPLLGISDINLDDCQWKRPDYELKFLFTLNALYGDLMTALIKISHHRINPDITQIKPDWDTVDAIERIGDRLALYFFASPSIEEWERALAAGLGINASKKFLELSHAQKIGEAPWIFEITDQNKIKPSPFYDNLMLEIKNDLNGLSQYFKLQKELKESHNKKKMPKIEDKLLHSQEILFAKFHVTKPEELEYIQRELTAQDRIFHFIIDGVELFSQKNLPDIILDKIPWLSQKKIDESGRWRSGKWHGFVIRHIHL